LADPAKRRARARREYEIREQIGRVHKASFGLYGSRKVWRQLKRKGIKVAKCTVEQLMGP
jgi:transposase InsO family protein